VVLSGPVGDMFRGNSLAKVDDKGRLKLPSKFRSIIEPRFGRDFFVTSLNGDSIRIYPMEIWTTIEEKLAESSGFKPAVMRFKNRVNYYGQMANMDSQGRVLLHPLVREKAEIAGEVAVLGQQNFLEIWHHANLEAKLESEPLTDEDLDHLAELGI
jgi:MraZ protein